MLLPLTDPRRLQELISLLDQNALDLMCEDFDHIEHPSRLPDLIDLPATPCIGPDVMARLHLFAAGQHPDQDWIDAHLTARAHYVGWERDLLDHGQDILTRAGAFDHPELDAGCSTTTLAPPPARPDLTDLATTTALAIEMMAVWEDSGRSPTGSDQVIRFAGRIPDQHKELAAGLCYGVLQFHSAPEVLAALAPEEQAGRLAGAADAAAALARLLPGRGAEFRVRALLLGLQSLEAFRTDKHPALPGLALLASESAESLSREDPRRRVLGDLATAAGEAALRGTKFEPPVGLRERLALPEPTSPQTAGSRHTYRIGRTLQRLPASLSDIFTPDKEDWSLGEIDFRIRLILVLTTNVTEPAPLPYDQDPDATRTQLVLAVCLTVKQLVPDTDSESLERVSGSILTILDRGEPEASRFMARSAAWLGAPLSPELRRLRTDEALILLSEAIVASVPRWQLTLLLERSADRLGIGFYQEAARHLESADVPESEDVLDMTGWRFRSVQLAALDRLAAIAAATDATSTGPQPDRSQSLADEAREHLLSLVDYPTLTGPALARLPIHRLTADDQDRLQESLTSRLEFFAGDLVPEPDLAATRALELTLLRALDAASGTPWWTYDIGSE